MRSRDDGRLVMTPIGERAARAVGIVALTLAMLLAVAQAIGPADHTPPRVEGLRVDERNADSAVAIARTLGTLVARSAAASDSRRWPAVSLSLSVVPSASVRAVLGSAVRAGLPFAWSDSLGVGALALDVSHVPAPHATTVIAAQASLTGQGTALAVTARDAAGLLDSVSPSSLPLRIRATRLQGPVRIAIERDGHALVTASMPLPAPVTVRRVLLMAQTGWESKFVIAALEEMGWLVDATLLLSPTSRVTIGAPGILDTTRYSVAVVLDSGLARTGDVRRFLEQGGGVVIAGDAVRDPRLVSLLPAHAMDDRAVVAGALLTDQPRRGLSALRLRADSASVVLEREDRDAMVVAARRGVGRVLVSGYRSTWHWRMEGTDGAADAHRRWWNDLLSAVTWTPPSESVEADTTSGTTFSAARWPGDAAPVADLVARIGASTTRLAPPTEGRGRAGGREWLLFAIACSAMLTEWAMRRLRGAP